MLIGLIGFNVSVHIPPPVQAIDEDDTGPVSAARDRAGGTRSWLRSNFATSTSISAPVHVIRDVNLTVKDKEFVVFLGPSGCGKTTTLRAIAGLEDIDSGDILIDGKPVQDLHASERDIAFVFQNYALYPHLTVYENMAFPLRAVRHEPGRSRRDGAARSPDRWASTTCSSAVRRRCRAATCSAWPSAARWCAVPRRILLDEPIGSLDAKLRETMRVELKRLHRRERLDLDLRDARPGRGHVARRPHRRHERRHAAAGRHADRGLSPSGQPVRRPVHRLAR